MKKICVYSRKVVFLQKKREKKSQMNNHVTIVKAIGIMLMVLGHTLVPDTIVWKVIYTFHMPLFFIMSGYCFKEAYLEDFPQFIWRKCRGIYLPLVAYSLLFLALHNIFCHWHLYSPDEIYSWNDFRLGLIGITTKMNHSAGPLLGTFWFLKDLFFGNIVFYCMLRLSRGKGWLTFACLFVLAELFCILGLHVPWFGFDSRSIYASVLICAGYLIRVHSFRLDRWWKIGIGVALIALEVILVDQIGFNYDLTPWSMLTYLLPAVAGTLIVYEAAVWLNNRCESRLLLFVGSHTLAVMALHFLAFKIVSLLIIVSAGLPIDHLSDFPVILNYAQHGWWIAYTAVGLSLPLCLAWLWTKGLRATGLVRRWRV